MCAPSPPPTPCYVSVTSPSSPSVVCCAACRSMCPAAQCEGARGTNFSEMKKALVGGTVCVCGGCIRNIKGEKHSSHTSEVFKIKEKNNNNKNSLEGASKELDI